MTIKDLEALAKKKYPTPPKYMKRGVRGGGVNQPYKGLKKFTKGFIAGYLAAIEKQNC